MCILSTLIINFNYRFNKTRELGGWIYLSCISFSALLIISFFRAMNTPPGLPFMKVVSPGFIIFDMSPSISICVTVAPALPF